MLRVFAFLFGQSTRFFNVILLPPFPLFPRPFLFFLTGLMAKKKEGTFLFRTTAAPGSYIISVVYKKKSTHHTLALSDDGGTFMLNKKADLKCATLDAVYEHLQQKRKPYWPLKLVEGIPGPASEPEPEPEPEPEEAAEQEAEEAQAPEGDGGDVGAPDVAGDVGGLRGRFEAATTADGAEDATDDGLEYYSKFVDVSMSPWYHQEMSAAEAKSLILIEDEAADTEGRFLFADDNNVEGAGDGKVSAYVLYVACGGQVNENRVVKVLKSGQLQVHGRGTGCSTLLELAEYLKADQPGWNTLLTVGVPGIRSLTAEEQDANEQMQKDRIQAAKEAAIAKEKAEREQAQQASAQKMNQTKAAIAAENAALKEREANVKAAVPEQVRRASMKKVKDTDEARAKAAQAARAAGRAERHHERKGMNLLGQAAKAKGAGHKIVARANQLLNDPQRNYDQDSSDSEAELDAPIKERRFSTIGQEAKIGAVSGRGSPLTVDILEKVKPEDAAAAILVDPKEDGKYLIRQVTSKKKGRRSSIDTGETLALDFLFSGRPESLEVAKNHNGVYEIEGEVTHKFSLVEVLEELTSDDTPQYWPYCSLRKPIAYPLDKKVMKTAQKEYKDYVKAEKKAGRMK